MEDRETPAKANAFGSYRRAAYTIAARYIILKHITTTFEKSLFSLIINFEVLKPFLLIVKKIKNTTNGGTRTHNPRIRSPMRYPLRHAGKVNILPCIKTYICLPYTKYAPIMM